MADEAQIMGKIVVSCRLVVDSPLLIGAGRHGEAGADEIDTAVLKDKFGTPFIPGTSLAGVLREETERSSYSHLTKKIFGELDYSQSTLQIYDVTLGETNLVMRDGVSIDSYTGTGIDRKKFDFEAVDIGAKGNLSLTLTLRRYHLDDRREFTAIKDFVGWLMAKLGQGLKIGAMTAKGFGRVHGDDLCGGMYDFRRSADVCAWLLQKQPMPEKGGELLSPSTVPVGNERDFIVDATFSLNSSLIVRDYNVNERSGDNKINAASMYSRTAGAYVIPGTSIKGVLRHHAEFILRKLGVVTYDDFLDDLMGYPEEKQIKRKSRLYVSEVYIDKDAVAAVPQTRNRIDRFTGGTIDGALYTTKPIFQKKVATAPVTMHWEIKDAKDSEAGLLLLLLRDIWLGRVPFGGEKSVGRGTLCGFAATISFAGEEYIISDNRIVSGRADNLARLTECIAKEAVAK